MTPEPRPAVVSFYLSFFGGPLDGLVEPFEDDPRCVVQRLEIKLDHDLTSRAVYTWLPDRTQGLVRPLVYAGSFTL
ncbi:hypothetical protein OG244_28685 [Streptomyces brevispora]|uniref:hypothetical protein n=1 Tax=Streptomyces brevispora TaxID=887462 RepID=UPI002E3020FF|nr:hypothetical protein [Streptomyces brevispora]